MKRGRRRWPASRFPHDRLTATGLAVTPSQRAARAAAYLRALALSLQGLRRRRVGVHNTQMLLCDGQGRSRWSTAYQPAQSWMLTRMFWHLNARTDDKLGLSIESVAPLLQIARAIECTWQLPEQPPLWTVNEGSSRNGWIASAVLRLARHWAATPGEALPPQLTWQPWPASAVPRPDLPDLAPLRVAQWCWQAAEPAGQRPVLIGVELVSTPQGEFWHLHQWFCWHPEQGDAGLQGLTVEAWPDATGQM